MTKKIEDGAQPMLLPSANGDGSTRAASVNTDDYLSFDDDSFYIPSSELLRVLQGVAVATKTPAVNVDPIAQWISLYGTQKDNPTDSLSFGDWNEGIVTNFLKEDELLHIANLTLGVTFLREKSRRARGEVPLIDLALAWDLIHGALTSPLLARPLGSVSRSAQGFLAVPLCSLVEEGHIVELFRLHVWLPDGQRGDPEFAIHSHQPFAQSWILAGEGKNHSYNVKPVATSAEGTHAAYELSWNDGRNTDRAYKTHQASSTITNTRVLMHASPKEVAVHHRDATYTIPEAAFHSTEVLPDAFHATLFFFDSHRGFMKDARVLGPKDVESKTQLRDASGVTSTALANMVNAVREWEMFMDQGRQHARRAEWEHALREFNSALNMCQSTEYFSGLASYRHLVLGELGNTNRRFGRYEKAKEMLEQAVEEMGSSLQRVEFSGELGVIYRHMNRLEEARHAFQVQYDTAKQLQFDHAMCRAVGNLGMINYQLSQQNGDEALLEMAIAQLNERVRSARHIKETIQSQSFDLNIKLELSKIATTWESIGLSRLSLCYAAKRDAKQAIATSLESLNLSSRSEDSTVVAMSRFFYGRALLLDQQLDEALKQFNPWMTCTPAMALCKEPSEEHRQYLRELVDVGADMDLVDEQGYTALDYAVFNGDVETEALVLEGLRRKLEGDVENELNELQVEARIRKGYRELFQEKMRPALLSGGGLQSLRHMYANELAADDEKRRMFDGLKFMRFLDFLKFGKLPRSSDKLAREFMSRPNGNDRIGTADFVIFFSYRWINREPNASSPDDIDNMQYRRMIAAAEQFLKLHPSVEMEKLGIWVDHACIDQENPAPGVSALPMILVQCDAVISLFDDLYHHRAWCSVEVMMVQTLRKSYGQHLWYEQVLAPQSQGDADDAGESRNEKWILREGPIELEIVMAEKRLTFEEDRAKVLFLERQSRLLG
ncbi:uncharacterized protein BDCG_08696 [Blastomyces dermatitidis ER-3]|uniref:Uncharacterized protein n=2 Tax=Ajellomyces dermatitidis TaxID=5039 RepID=F2TNU4_AJEDA|nr:uncharacterized protein BDCG_08696 [Blastomyces dermatitidis ER-3]EEQ85427.2 hypothetical protein BDCG_08696 [Blastomyces dermatitidis ER-3]EGE84907.2 hypothetical protein BDDG_07852 [Blastomyces dermatitidis ATCC 18188]EQL33519.1 hypothetical protein BDFG_04454 [Blastomyces dermatitidis ATCC 26199]